MDIYTKLKLICKTKIDVDLKTMCSMHIGGVGKCVCFPKNIKQTKKLLKFLLKNKIYYYVIGNGTNIVFEDGGFSAVLVCLKELKHIKARGKKVFVEGGVNLFALNNFCVTNNLSGLEWSYGIPGTVGGAICMNAGAYGFEIKDFVKYVWVIKNGKPRKVPAKKMGFSYRKSNLRMGSDVVVRVCLKLKKGIGHDIKQKQETIFINRKNVQPYGTFNAGSIFKRTINVSAGKIIDKLGLKNVKIGDIKISEKHANFFINLGNGSSKDLHSLIDYTKAIVKEKEGIDLHEEIIFVKNKED